MKKKLLILGASELQVPAIKEANLYGAETIVVDMDDQATGISCADKFYNVSTLDYDAVLDVARKEKIDGIMTICSDRPMNIVARVGEALNLNTISVETAYKATNKAAMRMALKEKNVPIPMFRITHNIDEMHSVAQAFALPVIIKPSDNSGSRGISMISSWDELDAAYEYAKSNTMDGIVLIEEYMTGAEVSVEVFCLNGKPNVLQITDKITTGAPHFVEMGHTQPSQLPLAVREDIKNVAIAAAEALGITTGPAHVEIKATEGGAKIVELGARLGGDYITTDLTPLSTGVNMVKAAVCDALGESVDIEITKDDVSAIRYFVFNKYINLSAEVLSKIERMYVNRMDRREILSSRDREGFFIVSADNHEDLLDKVKFVEAMIE